MGWTAENMHEITAKTIRERLDNGFSKGHEVLKSVMVGNTYYAAVKTPTGEVTASIILTRRNNEDYFNFCYKDMTESMGPFESRCPASILNLLTETESEWANAWRKRCCEYNKNLSILRKIPFGEKVRVGEKEYEKCRFRGRKKWINWKDYTWLSESRIAEEGFRA